MPFGWSVIRIAGASMEPLLNDGDFALARRFSLKRSPREGDIALIRHPTFGTIVKRIRARRTDGRFEIEGTGAMTTARVDLGAVPPERITARLVLRITPNGVRWLPRET